ncbi:hypothetical protein MKK84_18840 [Methylobacterium sp. E-065]|uniref:hypothetical protein n=1 Tax=Methylobacterium sp. E-065 TaxID=2836583 RepID=UPI001FBAAE14|nr:hypothetical protein [Methylobacterium sp. E-065]MCJ2019469.1 hypothetical protein [Methylobacterium sp. E-065]
MLLKFAAPLVLATCLAAPAMAQSTPGKPVILIHGNYCGPGNNAPLAPIDALDAACARHDACTPDDALPVKACNLRLEREAAEIANDPRQPQSLQSMAGLVSFGASMMLAKADPEPDAPVTTARAQPHEAALKSQWSALPSVKSRPSMR